MGHYDCKDCGYPEGIEFGTCENCTTIEYLNLMDDSARLYMKHKATADRKRKKLLDSLLKNDKEFMELKSKLDKLVKSKSKRGVDW